jgi:hypothetical protein
MLFQLGDGGIFGYAVPEAIPWSSGPLAVGKVFTKYLADPHADI